MFKPYKNATECPRHRKVLFPNLLKISFWFNFINNNSFRSLAHVQICLWACCNLFSRCSVPLLPTHHGVYQKPKWWQISGFKQLFPERAALKPCWIACRRGGHVKGCAELGFFHTYSTCTQISEVKTFSLGNISAAVKCEPLKKGSWNMRAMYLLILLCKLQPTWWNHLSDVLDF